MFAHLRDPFCVVILSFVIEAKTRARASSKENLQAYLWKIKTMGFSDWKINIFNKPATQRKKQRSPADASEDPDKCNNSKYHFWKSVKVFKKLHSLDIT